MYIIVCKVFKGLPYTHCGLGKVKLEGYRCERCGHIWCPRSPEKEEEPETCPKCRSPYWNKPKVKKG